MRATPRGLHAKGGAGRRSRWIGREAETRADVTSSQGLSPVPRYANTASTSLWRRASPGTRQLRPAEKVGPGAGAGFLPPGPFLLQWMACSLLVALPFLVVHFPPITDLPQHAAQIRLFQEAWHDPDGAYRIQWFTPYSLQYVILAAAWLAVGPEQAGRVAMLAVGLLWVAAAHLIAWQRQRSPAAAALASVLFFTQTISWGFYGFAVGWAVFAMWFLLTTGPRRDTFRWTDAPLALAVGLLFYTTHALWLAAGAIWLLVSSLAFRVPVKVALVRGVGLAPLLLVAAMWYLQLGARGFTSSTIWSTTPTGRLSFSWLVDAMFGGLRGPTEFGIATILALWVLLTVIHGQRATSTSSPAPDREFLTAAAMFFTFALILPDKYTNTIVFAARWVPTGAALLLLGCPRLCWRPAATCAVTLGVLAVLSLATASAWRQFERSEMSGLEQSLAALPERPRVIGLDFVKESRIVKGRPFLQAFAYAQVLRGGTLNFSFAEFAPSLVVFRSPPEARWTRGLEWFPEWLQPTDLPHFDHALINGEEIIHTRFSALPGVRPVTREGRWRLYHIEASRS
jgi:hypothetical protein